MSVRLLQRQSAPAVVAPTYKTTTYDFTGANGAAQPSAFSRATAYPTTGPVTIQNNRLQLATGSTSPWSGASSVFVGNPDKPEGDATSGALQIGPNAEYRFDMTLLNLSEHYPSIAFRSRSAELWPDGGGANINKSGYSLVLGVAGGNIDLVQGYNTSTIGSIPFTFPSNALKWLIKIDRKVLAFKIWAASGTEPTAWTYQGTPLFDESDGSLAFAIFNGPAAEQKTMQIDNLEIKTENLTLGTTVQAPATDPAGFTRLFTENFNTPAPAGTGTSSFLNVYSNSIQPYDEVSPKYMQRAMMSAHDGVLDAAMDGARGHAAVFGSSAISGNRIGGRFAMRAKAIGAFGNGPAVMIWPSSTAEGPWSDGEIDFPESVSGPGGLIGFQDAPWIHHHRMNADMNLAQDVALGVSWRDWHVYSLEWYPAGKAPAPYAATSGLVVYYVDEVEVYRTTQDVPTTVHRYMYQVGEYGQPGNMLIDWVTISALA